jgi:hypothetical protein
MAIIPLAPLEIKVNRIFAVLLVIATIPFFLNILTIPTIILFAIFAICLFYGKKYHLVTNIIFLIFSVGVYFIPLPIGWGVYNGLKQTRLDGFNFLGVSAIFNISTLIFVTFAVRNILGNIQAFFTNSIASRNSFYLISLGVVFVTLITFPFFDSVRLRGRAFQDDGGGGKLTLAIIKQDFKCGKDSCGSTSYSRNYTARYDSASNKYIYRLNFRDPIAESIVFTEVAIDGKKINFLNDGRVECLNCQKDAGNPYNLTFPAGNTIDFIIRSTPMIKNIKFIEQGGEVDDFFFWK